MLEGLGKQGNGHVAKAAPGEGEVRLESGLVVPQHVAQAAKKQVRWSRSEFKSVNRASRFLGEQGLQMALFCPACGTMVKGTIDPAAGDRVWECKCMVRRVVLGE